MKNMAYGSNPIPNWLSHLDFEKTSHQLPELPFNINTVIYTERYPDILSHISESSIPTIYVNGDDTTDASGELVLETLPTIPFRRIICKETEKERYIVFQLYYPSTTYIPSAGNACFVHALMYGIFEASITLKRMITTYGKSRYYFREVLDNKRIFNTTDLQPFFPSLIENNIQVTQHDCIELLNLLLDNDVKLSTLEQTERKYTASNKLISGLATVTVSTEMTILNIITYPDTPTNKDIIDLYQYPIVDEVEGQAYKYKIITRNLIDSDCLIFTVNKTRKYNISFKEFIHNTISNTYFQLKFVIVYYGSGVAGHYVCYYKSSNGWMLYDDMKPSVVVVTEDIKNVLSSNGVIFVYEPLE